MSSAHIEPVKLSEDDRDQLAYAYAALTLVLNATPLVFIMEDDRGVFLHFPGNHQVEIARLLRDTDWQPTVRLVEEHHCA